jgi:TolA-binding protein
VPKAASTAQAQGRASLGESVRREWRVRRRDGSVSVLRELTTLQRWIVEGTLGREDEIGLDGETWRVLGTIPDLGPFFAAADARAQVAILEQELARLRARPQPAPEMAASAPAAPSVPTQAARPRPRTLSTVPPTPVASPPLNRALSPVARASPYAEGPGSSEPAFTRTAGGFGIPPTDDWEPPKLSRGLGAWVVGVLLLLVLAGTGTAAYFYVWRPERQRAREEQARNSQLERDQAEREARLKAAEQRAKEELLQSLAAAQGRDAGTPAPDAGASPRGALEPPVPPASAPAGPAPAEARVPSPTLAAGPNKPPSPRAAPDAEASGAAPAAPVLLPGGPQTFEDWMAEADRRRTHERASSALAAYDRALALKPQRSEAHAGRGLALLDLGRRPEALVEFQRALELDPRDGVAVLGLAETYRSLGRTEEARRAYQRYLEGWPGGPDATAARAALESLKE